jgi:hypothetical protein
MRCLFRFAALLSLPMISSVAPGRPDSPSCPAFIPGRQTCLGRGWIIPSSINGALRD